ncbi:MULTISPECIES: hypothetical protein [Streptomyces]|jgi:hypothetical protein|uniref:Integral membrane protein n=1 Tax=Streptomyces spinosisporus TaxID=2927582 RepID=A0ABS9XKF6_9ACTN|nr:MULTISPECIES: hypothetical protein [Streptomyces]MCI3241836.1 hypothetical protein [Streptomyces spinosisporus]WUB33847.1 hypothetical protein OHN38_02575 [Streptomyces sp. NBC_00588]
MITLLVAAFLVVHGLLHPGVWTAPQQRADGAAAPFTPGHSWLLTSAGVSTTSAATAALTLAWWTAVVYVVAGSGVAAGAGWWPTAALVAASSGLVLKAVWFDPWLSVGVLLDLGVIAAVACSWPASLY